MKAIFIHGGAGRLIKGKEEEMVSDVLMTSIENAINKLENNKSSVDAVVAAIENMENSGIFNAGRGSFLTINRSVEMDAAIATSKYEFGAVAAVPNVRNPIRLAYSVMTKTRHKLIVGKQAKDLAKKWGFREYKIDELTKLKLYDEIKDRMETGKSPLSLIYKINKAIYGDTVGAIVMDDDGLIAVGVSTGGLWMKLPGRVGDSPIFGSGIYASPMGGAVATGIGEIIMISNVSYKIIEGVRDGQSLMSSARRTISYINKIFGRENTGVISLIRTGEACRIHNTPGLSSAIWWEGLDKPIIKFQGEEHYKF